MALLAAAVVLAPRRRWSLHVAHLDHALRAESTDDAEFVASQAAERDIPFHAERIDVGALAREQRRSIEEAGREARYAFLERVALGVGGGAHVATAHTADDSAETILLNIARGTGVTGLRGIPVRRGPIVRPLLHARRGVLRKHLNDAGVPFRQDPSNTDLRHARNRVRAEVLPALERINPGAVDALLRLGRLAADDDDLLTRLASEELERRRLPGAGIRIDWRDPPAPGLARRVLRAALGEAPSMDRIDAVLGAAAGAHGGQRIELGRRLVATVRQRVIAIERESY